MLIDDLITNHFLPPSVTSYNHANIPFGYPPLGFYLSGLISVYLHINLLTVIQYLPMILNLVSIIPFYFLSRLIVIEEKIALLSTLVFSLLPMQYKWNILGGGITRSLGMVFCIIALYCTLNYFFYDKRHFGVPAILSCGCTILSHPEFALFLFYSLAFFILVKLFTNISVYLRKVGIIIGGIILLISPWILWIYCYVGSNFFLPFTDSGFSKVDSIVDLLTFKWSEEAIFPILTLFGFVGIIISIKKNEYIIPVWFMIIWIIQGRAPVQKAIFPLSLLAGIGIFYTFKLLTRRMTGYPKIFLIGILSSIIISASWINGYISVSSLAKPISTGTQEAASWINHNLPEDSKLYVFINNGWVFDNYSEWFSALTMRECVSVVQGYEWLPGFSSRISKYDNYREEFLSGRQSFSGWLTTQNEKIDAIIIPKTSLTINDLDRVTKGYQRIFENNDILIINFASDK